MNGFTYPSDLYKDVKARWKQSIYPSEKIPNLPDERTFVRIVDVVYHASFLTEERRRVWFRVIYASKEAIMRDGRIRTSEETSERYKLVCFKDPRAFNVNEIVKLAPAADPAQVLIWIHEDSDKELKIWGLVEEGISFSRFLRHELDIGVPPPNSFTVSSKTPGQVTISRMGFILLILEQGRIVKSSEGVFYDGPVAKFLERGVGGLCKEISRRIKKKHFSSFDDENEVPKQSYIAFLEQILEGIREKFHGGTLVMIPDEINADDIRLQDRIVIKYPCNYDASELFVNALVGVWKRNQTLGKKLSKKSISGSLYRRLEKENQRKQHAEEMLKSAAILFSSLSAVDGAVVLTDKLRLLGFGAEITAISPRLNQVKVITDFQKNVGENKAIELFGTRHRSAFRFCSSFEDSVVFIVSQDGEIKVTKRVGSEVVLWLNINVCSMGF